MTDDDFAALVNRLEGVARQHPDAYRRRVLGLALLGNVYLATILLLLAALVVLLVLSVTVLKALALKLALVVGVFIWVLLKAMRVKLHPPTGRILLREEAPALFGIIDELREQLGAPPFHRVLITEEFNAAVVQSPRFGAFGWPLNGLLIGLPLMKSLSIEQLRAVLAHEFGHLARGHALLGNWIYCQRLRWQRLLDALEEQQGGSFLFKPFLKWYAPYFNAYSFPLARANEYEADAAAARLTSPQAAAQALTAVNVVGSWLGERYWPQIHQAADDQPQPGFAPYSGLNLGTTENFDAASAQDWLERAMNRQTSLDDTHPALRDRLDHLGEAPRLALPSPEDCADQLLGGSRDAIAACFDRDWQAAIQPAWEARHHEVRNSRLRLAELNARAAKVGLDQPGLDLNEAYERALLTESIGKDADAARVQLQQLYAAHPEAAGVVFSLSARLLARDDAAGCALMERAMALDETGSVEACELLRDYHWRQQRQDEAHRWETRRIESLEIAQADEHERSRVLLNDHYDPHELPEDVLAELRQALAAVPGLRKAYLFRKRVRHHPQRPCYVCGVSAFRWYQWHSKRRAGEVQRRVLDSVSFPGETLVVSIDGENYRFGRKFFWKRQARIV